MYTFLSNDCLFVSLEIEKKTEIKTCKFNYLFKIKLATLPIQMIDEIKLQTYWLQ